MEISTRVRTYSHVFGNPEKKEKEQAAQKTIDIEHTPEVKDKINESNNKFDINDLSNPLIPDSSEPADEAEFEGAPEGPFGEAVPDSAPDTLDTESTEPADKTDVLPETNLKDTTGQEDGETVGATDSEQNKLKQPKPLQKSKSAKTTAKSKPKKAGK